MSRRVEVYNRRVDATVEKMLTDLAAVATPDLVKAIDVKLRSCSRSEDDARRHRLDAARMYVVLRMRVEAEGLNWWRWHADNFDRSRADASRLLAVGGAPEPAAALAEERAKRRASMAKSRNVSHTGHVGDNVVQLLVKRFENDLKKLERNQQREVWRALDALKEAWNAQGEAEATHANGTEDQGQCAPTRH